MLPDDSLHRPGRAKAVDGPRGGQRQLPDCLRHRNAHSAIRLYSGEPLLHRGIRIQRPVVDQGSEAPEINGQLGDGAHRESIAVARRSAAIRTALALRSLVFAQLSRASVSHSLRGLKQKRLPSWGAVSA